MKAQTTEDKLRRLRQDERYQALSPAKQNFVRTYIETNGDKIKSAAATSELLKSEQAALQKAYRYLKDFTVRILLRTIGGFDLQESLVTRAELARLTSQRLRDATTSSAEFVRLAELLQAMDKKKPKRKPVTIEEAVLAAERNQ